MVNPSEPEGVTVNAKIKDKEGNVVSTLENGNPAGIIRMTIDGEVHPWSVEDPYLYDLEISLLKNGKVIAESVRSRLKKSEIFLVYS